MSKMLNYSFPPRISSVCWIRGGGKLSGTVLLLSARKSSQSLSVISFTYTNNGG